MYVVYETRLGGDRQAVAWFNDRARAMDYETYLCAESVVHDAELRMTYYTAETETCYLPDDHVVGTGRVAERYVGEDFTVWS